MHEVKGVTPALTKLAQSYIIGHVRLSYNLYFSACFFFSRNTTFLSQQISRTSNSACFFSEANGANGER